MYVYVCVLHARYLDEVTIELMHTNMHAYIDKVTVMVQRDMRTYIHTHTHTLMRSQ